MIKENTTKFRGNAFFVGILLFGFIILENQLAFNTSNQLNEKEIISAYDNYKFALEDSLGVAEIVVVSGADIFNAKCIACHKYDVKLVGPPYNEVLPKYENDMDGLKSFIRNPVKIREDYPIMPSQGLKPAEVEAIAEYIMDTYKENK